jgi:FtsH-binding integral membrane protein
MDFLKTIGGKIATGLVSLAVVAAAVSWWQTDPQTRSEILSISGRITGWFFIVLLIPWIGFWLIGWIARRDSNAAGAALVIVLAGIEATVLAWLFNWSIHGSTEWILFAAAVAVAGVYNLFACDWIAEKIE